MANAYPWNGPPIRLIYKALQLTLHGLCSRASITLPCEGAMDRFDPLTLRPVIIVGVLGMSEHPRIFHSPSGCFFMV